MGKRHSHYQNKGPLWSLGRSVIFTLFKPILPKNKACQDSRENRRKFISRGGQLCPVKLS
jgi:hypothetical protein